MKQKSYLQIACTLLTALFFACLLGIPRAQAQSLTVIAHPSTPRSSITRTQLADVFMKKTRSWSDGAAIRPVDQSEGSEGRRTFLASVLHRSEREMTKYWIGQKLYSGDYAPLKLSSDAAVIGFVSTVQGAVGYVTSTGPEDLSAVKIISVTE